MVNLENQLEDWKKIMEKGRDITAKRKYMNAEDRQRAITKYLERVKEYNEKYQTKFNISRRPE